MLFKGTSYWIEKCLDMFYFSRKKTIGVSCFFTSKVGPGSGWLFHISGSPTLSEIPLFWKFIYILIRVAYHGELIKKYLLMWAMEKWASITQRNPLSQQRPNQTWSWVKLTLSRVIKVNTIFLLLLNNNKDFVVS